MIKKERIDFSKSSPLIKLSNLIDIQKKSYEAFLQKDVPPAKRKNIGLQRVFKDIFPIESYNGLSILEFVEYSFGEPRYTLEECKEKNLSYAAPLLVVLRLIIKEEDEYTKEKRIRDIKEQEIYVMDFPLMTPNGTFIINGAERVIVSQLHRSPGVFFEKDTLQRTSIFGKPLFTARVIPYRGAWLEFEFDTAENLYVRINKKRKLLVTSLIRALGYASDEAILEVFYDIEEVSLSDTIKRKILKEETISELVGKEVAAEVTHPRKGVLFKEGEILKKSRLKEVLKEEIPELELPVIFSPEEELVGKICAQEIKIGSRGEVIVKVGEQLKKSQLQKIKQIQARIKIIKDKSPDLTIINTIQKDNLKSQEKALLDIYTKLLPGSPPIVENAKLFLERLFFKKETYSLAPVGRYKLNTKLKVDIPDDVLVLTPQDIFEIIKYLIRLKNGQGAEDDIDHLGNRRVRVCGELVESVFRIALARVQSAARERMSIQEIETAMPSSLFNPKIIADSIQEFFGSDPLSQFMDQVNPLSELTHRRRISALGRGGLSRERAGFEVRDIHYTHYGRICPIETPEGANIGLIASLGLYARTNHYGFIETPYRKVEKGVVTNKVEYLTADEEEEYILGEANVKVDEKGQILDSYVLARHRGNLVVVPREEVNYVDLTASQLVSLSTALIPFLEHDDANRALMGSNMQRQAVPLISPEAPIVGTGVEEVVARESGLAILAEHNGIVEEVSADLIIVSREDKEGLDVYHLSKFKRTNNDTCINQIPVVRKGQRVKKGDILADGPAMEHGRLALGCNVLVAFMPWRGYNFEDAIVISEELVRNDKFTSIHIKELEVEARDTKLGREEITKDIPNAGEESLDNLDENGIIWVGAEVQPGDILVGKVTPRGETELLPEERLLRAIFGDKAGNVKNTSLRVPPGVSGRVIDVKVFSRRAKDKDAKSISAKIKEEKARVETQKRVIERLSKKEIKKIILNADFMKEGQRKLQVVTEENFEEVFTHLTKIRFKDPKIREKVAEKRAFFDNLKQKLDAELKAKTDRLKKGDELKPGVNKMVKVYIAQKKKISVGDKISGRHGNKGVLAKILPIEDMPYLPDGTPVQILLNPLGVPSRMNLGQILETHLGWAAKELGYEIITPVFSGAQEGEIKELLTKAHEKTAKEGRGELFKTTGKTILYDGRTGEPFDAEVTVGYIYMMKLSHLADEKIHARSSGSYSLITQQPLGGKAQFGGQRFGEMEVWALEGYGAAHTLQEILTVKSDDVEGRVKIYESIVKGENPPLPGIPESFNVLIKEMQGLALNVELLTERGVKKPGSEGREKIQGLRIGLSSPEKILAQSYGEVKKPDTINYRTYKPEKGGLFCERIFGPVKDWECHCGKYKRMKNKGIICDRCGVEVTLSKVRRERMGHIELATPVTHIWYVRGYPNVISKLLDMKLNTLESIIYYDSYVALSIDEKARRRVLTRLEEDIKRELEEKSALQNTPWEAEESFPRFAEEIRDRREDVIVKVGERVTSRAIAKVKEIGREEIKFSLPVEASIKGKLLAEGEGKPQEITDKVYEAIRSQGRENVTIVEPIEVCLKETVRREKLLQDKLAREIAELQEKLKEAKQTIENLSEGEVISEETYSELNTYQEKYGKFVVLESGGAAVKELLKRLNLPKLSQELRTKLNQGKLLPQQRNEIVKRLRVVNAMLNSKNKPEWMVLDVLPVIPPDLRPLVHLEGGRFATSDLNDFYRRIINRNNRLKWLQEIKAPEIILRNEKRMLQQAVDCLFENGRRGKPITGVGNRPIKSLTDLIKGKTGRFRQNLLGKRVDYSGRAVIVIGPELKLSQCGLPKEVALELFKPFILKELEEKELIHTLRDAKKNFEKGSSKIWDILEKVIKEHPVLLNRAPTLHRLGIQGFMPVLVEGKAISIHPLVCAAFNADFDGDTMAVHVPLSPEAQIETRVLMMSVNNFFSPAHGKPLVTPRQDMVIGCYYLTREKKGAQGEGRIFSSVEELFFALEQKIISLHAKVKVRWEGKILETTPGRVIFNTILPKEMRFINKEIDAKAFITLLLDAWEKVGHTRAVELLDELKGLGFEYATRFGLTIAMDDVKIPEGKERIIEKAEREVNKIISLYKKGVITPRERYNRIIDIWTHATDEISALLFKTLEEDQFGFNPVYMMVDSGSRGSRLQVRQLGGMRGLMAKPSGEIIESPIKRNLREGLSVLEYFISTHGARKGLADTALKTADAGYLTRKLIDVAHNIIVEEEDCGTVNGRLISAVREEGVEGAFSFRDKIIGRVALRDIVHPVDNKIIVKANEEITEECAKQIEEAGVEQVEVRSVLTCIAKRGVCQKCYGRDFTTRKLVELGEAVGIIAAQSIGEPGTQLTMRTFHIGGTASRSIEQSRVIAKVDGSVHFSNLKTVENKEGELVVLTRSALLQLRDVQGREKEVYYLPRGAILKVKDGEKIKENQLLAYWEPYTTPILTEVGGKIRFCDIIEGLTFREEIDEITGFTTRVIVEHKVESREAKKRPQIEIIGERGQVLARYDLPVGAQLVVEEGEEIGPGGVLAKIHKEVSKTKDITGGLPRVTELFEARKPKEAAVISEIDGVVKFGEVSKGIRKVIVEGPGGIVKEYAIPLTKHLTVHDGDKISAAEPLTDGPLDPHALLRVKGEKEVQEYLVNEIQEVYKLQGVEINDKHIEIIVKQMLSRVKIEDAGDTDFIVGTHVDKTEFEEVNYEMRKQGKRTAKARPELIGITRASLATRSFISAASFQETTRVLIDAAITNKVDNLIGLKENVIVGRMVPVGTGFRRYQEELI